MDISPYSVVPLASVTFFFFFWPVLCQLWLGHLCKHLLFNLFFLILALSKLIAYFMYKLTLTDHSSTYTHQSDIRGSLAASINHGLFISYVVQNLPLSLKCTRNAQCYIDLNSPQSPTVLPSVCLSMALMHPLMNLICKKQFILGSLLSPNALPVMFQGSGSGDWIFQAPGQLAVMGRDQQEMLERIARCLVGKCRVLALVLVFVFPMFLSAAASLSAGA